jgi:hypothetical protein
MSIKYISDTIQNHWPYTKMNWTEPSKGIESDSV